VALFPPEERQKWISPTSRVFFPAVGLINCVLLSVAMNFPHLPLCAAWLILAIGCYLK
jgi:hypothetical protein